jgi:signal peptidase I
MLPGLGQLYSGFPGLAVAAYLFQTAGAVAGIALLLFLPWKPLNAILGTSVLLGAYVAVIAHAASLAGRGSASYTLRPFNRWYVYGAVFLVSALAVGPRMRIGLRTYVQAFRIPSGSMEPTMLVGDYLLITTDVAPSTLRDGTLIVYQSVEDPDLRVLKRVEGVPGDTLAMRHGEFWRNGEPVTETYAEHTNPHRGEDATRRDQMRHWQVAHFVGMPPESYAPDLQDWGPVVVPPDSFFTLGDNRDASYDSRYYGFVPMANAIGRPAVIYFSLERPSQGQGEGIRWARIGEWPQ